LFALVTSHCSPLHHGLHHDFCFFVHLSPHVETVTLEVVTSEEILFLNCSHLEAVVEFVEVFAVAENIAAAALMIVTFLLFQ
jgi:hypothetical protein